MVSAFVSTFAWLPLIQSICLHGGYAEPMESPPVDSVVCISQEQCLEQFSRMSTGGNFIVGSFETKGCFSINRDVFFGAGTVDEFYLAESDLPGILERIWCDKNNNAAMKSSDRPAELSTTWTSHPTAQLSIYKTKQPLLAPTPVNPASNPSHTPIATQPTIRPISNKPSSLNKKNQPTPMPTASSNPTSRPSKTFQTVANPAFQLSDAEVAMSYRPTTRPTANPSPGRPSFVPSTASPSRLPSKKPVSKQPTAIPTPMFTAANPSISPTFIPGQPKNSAVIDSDVPQVAQDTAPPQWYPVGVSPLTISLIAGQIESVDELTMFILNHLLKEMEERLLPIEGSSNYVLVSPVPTLVPPQGTPLESSADIELRFVFIGLFYFSGDSVPTVEMLDDVAREAFAGEHGEEFVRSLQNAKDIGLRSARSVSTAASRKSKEGDVVENTLESANNNPTFINRWYILAIIFSVGLLLIAIKVLKTFYAESEVPDVSSGFYYSDNSRSHYFSKTVDGS